jgi:hypothetical protein
MNSNNTEDLIDVSTLQVHYFFEDDSHSMDANILNRCDYEVLSIIKEVANIFFLDIFIETEPIGEGGIKKWLKIISKQEGAKASIVTPVLVAVLISILSTPFGKIGEKLVEKIFEDTEMTELQKEKLRNEIKILKKYQNDIQLDSIANLDYNVLIKKRKSNFYDSLSRYPKVIKVSFAAVNRDKKIQFKEKVVDKEDFNKFVLVTDDLQPVLNEDAIIEIIAPVLKKGNYRWIGNYEGRPVHFNMKSEEFRLLVQEGKVEFKNGSSINCKLEIKRRVSSEGVEMIVGYNVIRVNFYFQNNNPIETKEGKQHRQIKEAKKNQLELFQSFASK